MEINSEKNKLKVITATGIPMLDDEITKQDIFDATICLSKDSLEALIDENKPQLVIISDKLSGDESTVRLLLNLKNTNHMIRFIYLAGNLDQKDQARVDSLGMLVLVGIYDIIISQKVNIDLVMDTVNYPKKEKSVSYLTKNLLDSDQEIDNMLTGLEYEKFDDEVKTVNFPNVYVITSVKPGTGKSFLSVNLACAIAKYGKNKPRVALIEADMQTLSIGTLLSVDEKRGNIKTAMEAVSKIYEKDVLIDNEDKLKHANRQIRNSMVTYKNLPNLDVLVGSSLSPQEIDTLHIIPQYFTYIIDVLRKEYDYVLVDTNSSIFHVSSFPIMEKAYRCYYILNLDFNNIRNNLRYQNLLKELKISDKVRYVLNENIENTKEFAALGVEDEPLNFTAEDIENKYFELVAKIPVLPKTVFLNRLYEGTPVVLDSDSKEVTNKAKLEILKIANEICEIDGEIEKLEKIIENRSWDKANFFDRLFMKNPNKPEKEHKNSKKKGKKAISENKNDEDKNDEAKTEEPEKEELADGE